MTPAHGWLKFGELLHLSLPLPETERRYWRGHNGGATYLTVAPTALWAMFAILAAEHGHGCTDDIVELEVEEVEPARVAEIVIRGDGEPDIPFAEMPVGHVACSEWP